MSSPIIVFPIKDGRYWVISKPLKVFSSSKVSWFDLTTREPGITTEPSLKIWLPKLLILLSMTLLY